MAAAVKAHSNTRNLRISIDASKGRIIRAARPGVKSLVLAETQGPFSWP
jgi:hypothetical protein